jgi:hypothetical protein
LRIDLSRIEHRVTIATPTASLSDARATPARRTRVVAVSRPMGAFMRRVRFMRTFTTM